jgi:hypothetical protein
LETSRSLVAASYAAKPEITGQESPELWQALSELLSAGEIGKSHR